MKAKSLMMLVVALLLVCGAANAQRYTDKLTRGLVAIPQGDKDGQDGSYGMSGTGIFVSWRILPGEYFDTGYNLYRGTTKLNEKPLTVSNYEDTKGSKTSVYKVVPVIRGVEREDLAATATPWAHQYWDIPAQKVLNRNGEDVTSTYSLNDCSVADVDGDGQMEFVAKRIKYPLERVPYCLDKYGNTSSPSIPLTISSELAGQELKDAIVSGFGAGLSWGTAHISLADCKVSPVIEY